MKRFLTAVIATALFCSVGTSAVKTEVVAYQHNGANLEGFIAYDDSKAGQKPAVLIVHEWCGHNPYTRQRAEQIAALGYVGFAVDMYGKGVMGKSPDECLKLATPFKSDRALMRARITAAYDLIKKNPQVDPAKICIMGYCFGGTTALELGRSGADLRGIVSFHGDLSSPSPADGKKIRGKVLALHGADDPYVPPAQVAGFEKEMRDAKLDWQLVSYGNTVHSFTSKEAGNDPSKGVAYNPSSDKRSWEAMKAFFAEVFQ